MDRNGTGPRLKKHRAGSSVRGAWRLAVYLCWTFLLIPFQALAVATGMWRWSLIPGIYHRGCARILGFDIKVIGERATDGPILFVSNHSSYLDITVLGGLIPGSFVAKSEVAGWPLFGYLAKLQRTVFIERKSKGTVDKQRDDIGGRLDQGDQLILFPEGTSSDGNRTLPFKTALFAVAARKVNDRPVTVQPVSITATGLDGLPMGFSFRSFYAWYGDMDLAPHLWSAFCQLGMTIEVEFHRPVTIDEFASRKSLGEYCYRTISNGVAAAITGRRPVPATVAASAAVNEVAVNEAAATLPSPSGSAG